MNESYVIPLVIVPLLLLLFISARLLTVLFHEFGHAIPALIISREPVVIFLGSYGEIEKSKCVNFGKRLKIYFKLNPLKWKYGMVKHIPDNGDFWKRLIISASGPLLSSILAILALWVVFTFDLNGFVKLLIIVFFLSALFDLKNLYPSKTPIVLYNGTYIYCDGYNIVRLIRFRKEEKIAATALAFYDKENYENAIKLFKKLKTDFNNREVLSTTIRSCFRSKNYKKAKEFYSKLSDSPLWQTLDANDLCNIGVIEARFGEYKLAMECFDRSLELDGNNIFALSNRGYTNNLFQNYIEALNDFNKAIEIDNDFAYAYANRAFTKIKLPLLDEALIDINKALSIDDKEPYAYRNFGIYYLEIKQYTKAMHQLQVAFDLDPDTHMIENYMEIAERKINRN